MPGITHRGGRPSGDRAQAHTLLGHSLEAHSHIMDARDCLQAALAHLDHALSYQRTVNTALDGQALGHSAEPAATAVSA